MIEQLSLSKASKILGVTPRLLRMWDAEGKIRTTRTLGGHRRIPLSEIERVQGKEKNFRIVTLVYVRCSTNKQIDNLERQLGRVLEYCAQNKYENIEIYKEIGSGLNEKRKQFNKLLKRLNCSDVKRVVIEYKDRISRFGFKTFEQFCTNLGIEVVVLNGSEAKEFEQELTEDIISLIASYSGRLYGKRGGRKKKQNA